MKQSRKDILYKQYSPANVVKGMATRRAADVMEQSQKIFKSANSMLKKGMQGAKTKVKKMKSDYDKAFEEGQSSPRKQEMKRMMRYGWRP